MVIAMAKQSQPRQRVTDSVILFLIWGCFPLYFKELIEYDAIEIIVHRGLDFCYLTWDYHNHKTL